MDSHWGGGVNGDELVERLPPTLMFRDRGEGVNGIRPPAVLEAKRPRWLLTGVDTDAVAIVNVIELTNECFDQGPGVEINEDLKLVCCRLRNQCLSMKLVLGSGVSDIPRLSTE